MSDYLEEWSDALDSAIRAGQDTDETPPDAIRLIAAFIRMCRPRSVLEFGTFSGFAASHFARACQANGFGHVTTYEYVPEWAQRSRENVRTVFGHEAEHWVTVVTGDALESSEANVDLAFIDIAPKPNYAAAFERIGWHPGALCFAHDTNMTRHFAEVHKLNVVGAEAFRDYMATRADWRFIDLPQNRGLLIAQRTA